MWNLANISPELVHRWRLVHLRGPFDEVV